MAKPTLQETYSKGLEALGLKPVLRAKTRKFRVFHGRRLRGRGDGNFYVGKAGAVRYGPSLSRPYPVSDGFKKRLAQEGNGGGGQ